MQLTTEKPLAVLKVEIQERQRERDIDAAFYALDDALDVIETYLNDFRDDDGKLDNLEAEEKQAVLQIERYLGKAQNALGDLGQAL